MKPVAVLLIAGLLAGCGAAGDPLQPTAGLNIGLGPGGLSVRPTVRVSDGNSSISATPGGVRAGTSAGPVSVGASL